MRDLILEFGLLSKAERAKFLSEASQIMLKEVNVTEMERKGLEAEREKKIEAVLNRVGYYFNLSRAGMLGKSRAQRVVAAKFTIARVLGLMRFTQSEISSILKRDVSTVSHYIKYWEVRLKEWNWEYQVAATNTLKFFFNDNKT